MKTIDRIQQFISEKGMSLNAFDAAIGASNGYIGRQIKNHASVGSDIVEKISCAFPEIDVLWLITGKISHKENGNNPPAIGHNEGGTGDNTAKAPPAKQPFASHFASPSASPNEKNDTKTHPLGQYYSPSKHPIKAQSTPSLPVVVTVDSKGNENVLYVPVKARAGYLNGYADPEYIETLPAYNMPGINNGTFRMFEVEGPSMAPNIIAGDKVIGQWVENIEEITNNRVYIIVCRSGVIVKRVLNRLKERGKLVIKSDTVNHRAEYPTYEIDPEEILEMWYCRMKLSSDFSEPIEVYHRLADVEADIAGIKAALRSLNPAG